MKKTFFVLAFLFLAVLGYAQISKTDLTAFMSKNDLSTGELTLWNTYGYNSSRGLYSTYQEFDLSKCSFSYSETAMTINYATSVVLIPYTSIRHIDFFNSDGKSHVHLTYAN
jgi:hypothetical protein